MAFSFIYQIVPEPISASLLPESPQDPELAERCDMASGTLHGKLLGVMIKLVRIVHVQSARGL